MWFTAQILPTFIHHSPNLANVVKELHLTPFHGILFSKFVPFFQIYELFVLNGKLFIKQVNCSKNNRGVFQKFLELF